MNSRSGQMTVKELISEISDVHSCQILLSWDELFGDKEAGIPINTIISARNDDSQSTTDQSRRILAHAMVEIGYLEIPGIKPRVLAMIKKHDFSVRHARTGLPLLSLSEIEKAPGEWLISDENAEKIREELLTDRQREIIDLKASEGRYTLEEAAEQIFESVLCGGNEASDKFLEELDGSVDIDCAEILKELSGAALRNELQMYWPGTDRPFDYDPTNAYTEVRVYYEEACWDDLNNWLSKHHFEIGFRFFDPKGAEENTKNKGVIKAEIVCVDWPLPIGKDLKKILDEEPKWVTSALISRGRPGGGIHGSHRWNPAQIAICLHDRWPKDSTTSKLTKVLQRYPKYLEQWNEALENIDSGS